VEVARERAYGDEVTVPDLDLLPLTFRDDQPCT